MRQLPCAGRAMSNENAAIAWVIFAGSLRGQLHPRDDLHLRQSLPRQA